MTYRTEIKHLALVHMSLASVTLMLTYIQYITEIIKQTNVHLVLITNTSITLSKRFRPTV